MKYGCAIGVGLLTATVFAGCAETPDEPPDTSLVRCEDQRGSCTAAPALICPPGTQPYSSNDPEITTCTGHCCIYPELVSTCNPERTDSDDSTIASYNCIPDGEDGTLCPGPWEVVGGNLTCEDGRSCCFRP